MFEQSRRRRAVKRVKPGDGRPLQPFRLWQVPGRALLNLKLAQGDGRQVDYAIDVRHWQNQSSGEVKAHLYRNGKHQAESKIPAAFPVEGGVVEVQMSTVGLKRCHYVADDGTEHQLTPDPRSAEGRRAHLDRERPGLSRGIGIVSVLFLLVGVVLLALQIAEPISSTPPIAERFGTFESPVHLPVWLNVGLTAGAALGSMERALRLRYHWFLDAAGN